MSCISEFAKPDDNGSVWAEAVWKLAWFLDDEDVSVDFVEARGFGVILTP